MKTLYIECKMGAAGDMLTAALLELTEDKEGAIRQLNAMGIPHVHFSAETSEKCGITGTHMHVSVDGEEESAYDSSCAEAAHDHSHEHEHHHHHHHSSLSDIREMIESLQAPDAVKAEAISVYEAIAQAESRVHGVSITDIHFHEVGTMDAVADVMAVCYLLHTLEVAKVIVSPVHVGSGTVRCAHGVLPVPAPATALLLKDVPIYGGEINGELCTPTGAALLVHFADAFGDMPVMRTEKIGYGMGKKDFARANCVRVFLGETADAADRIYELNCNVDDMTGEDLGFAMDAIYRAGAREVFYTPVQMKKNRPGLLLTAIVAEKEKDAVVEAVFRNTTTIGIRERVCERYVLTRKIKEVPTGLGTVRVKESSGYGVKRIKAEYDDLERIAKEKGLTLAEVRSAVAPYLQEI